MIGYKRVHGLALIGLTLVALGSVAGCPENNIDDTAQALNQQNAGTALAQQPAHAPEPAPAPPPPPAPSVLLDVTISALSPFGFPGFELQTFSPKEANKPVTIQLAGNLTGSRVAIAVFDSAFNLVAAEDLPVSNRSTLIFGPTTTGEHFIALQELREISTVYDLTVTQ